MSHSLLYRNGLLFWTSRLPAILGLRLIVIIPLYDPMLPLYLRDIQIRDMKTVPLLHPRLDLFICSFTLGGGQIQLIHIDLNADMMLCSGEFGQKTYRLNRMFKKEYIDKHRFVKISENSFFRYKH